MSIKQKTTTDIKVPNKDLEALRINFPHCFDKDGRFDIVKFQQQLNTQNLELTTEKESYGLDWLGKSYARLLASDPASTLLKADETHNAKPENANSENLLIKGDNLEVLKHLANAYYEQVKMIYIDPPYNTGSDGFVYEDDRKFTAKELQQLIGVDAEKAKRILDFTNSKSNSHSAWLTFMYPRLYIAKQLLKDDGVIFVSIDDNEVAQLRLLMDEVFGEENFVAEFVWSGKSGSEDDSHIRNNKEYILCYAKRIDSFNAGSDIKTEEKFIYYDEVNKDFYKRQLLRKWGDNSKREDRPNLYYPIKDGNGKDFYPTLPNGEDGCWRWSKETMQKAIDNRMIEFATNGKYEAYEKIYESDLDRKTKKFQSLLTDLGSSAEGTKEIKSFFNDQKIFSNPKPTILLRQFCLIANSKSNDLILDFFAGSGTTGDAVMQLNAEDGGNRKFILVQLPEAIDPKKNKTAYDFVKNELKAEPTIFEITKERITRAAKKINSGLDEKIAKLKNELPTEENKAEITKNLKLKTQNSFKIFETTPIWEDYDFEAEQFDSSQSLFDVGKLTDDDIKTLLITWKTYDGIPLTAELLVINFESLVEEETQHSTLSSKNYIAYYGNGRLYLMNKGFTTESLKVLLEKIDTDKHFEPKSIIAFGYHLESKSLREISENVKTYNNKKKSDIDFITRY